MEHKRTRKQTRKMLAKRLVSKRRCFNVGMFWIFSTYSDGVYICLQVSLTMLFFICCELYLHDIFILEEQRRKEGRNPKRGQYRNYIVSN